MIYIQNLNILNKLESRNLDFEELAFSFPKKQIKATFLFSPLHFALFTCVIVGWCGCHDS